ncbi:CcdC family protein [Salinibacillus xinjiangensis]|uniref:DUF1453 family protein n=1 Tax=Salinibacillus xinjiangensis TaxID=1229268 RepID=A0A6G1X2U9_9BACI|nr:cytochrome c biogenesis protein CcdC [Salinibacillus xinjiangensis]MRG85301.1 DUF1453 family protein [Salinibacillus xinjiangensis]
MFWIVVSSIVAFFMAIAMIFIRMKAAQKPATVKKIILPPLFMSTGAAMFLFPVFRVSWLEFAEAVIVGVVFSVFLIISTKFEIKNDDIYLIPSKAFIFILIGLLVARLILKSIIGQTISFGETSGMFFLLAFGMIISWRVAMLIKFLRLKRVMNENSSMSDLANQT